jgi:uncharacterized glyoxalase superfamily protein PhnB
MSEVIPLIRNRSMLEATVIPELAYPDPGEAAAWLCEAFGFRIRLRIGNHRMQLVFGDGALVAMDGPVVPGSVMVRVEDVDSHHARAAAAGATILRPPTDYPYGERQYTAEDPGGHRWTFSQSIADVDPLAWGGEVP